MQMGRKRILQRYSIAIETEINPFPLFFLQVKQKPALGEVAGKNNLIAGSTCPGHRRHEVRKKLNVLQLCPAANRAKPALHRRIVCQYMCLSAKKTDILPELDLIFVFQPVDIADNTK